VLLDDHTGARLATLERGGRHLMKVAFTIFKYFPFGGISRDLERIAGECRARGHAVRVYTLSWEGPPIAGVDVVVVPVGGLTNHARYARFAQWTEADLRARPVDLVVGMNKMPGIDVYYAGDSCYEEKSQTQRMWTYRLTARYRLFAQFERAVFGRDSDTEILTISDVQTPLFRRHYGTQWERLHPLPPGIDPSRKAPPDRVAARRDSRRDLGVGDHEHLVLFVGSGFVKKGLDRAIAAFAALPPALRASSRLFVVGEDNAKPFAARVARLGLADRVTFFRGRDDIPRFLFAADALALPAYDENTGTVILEAMIAGLPVLVTENCGYAHYVEDADAGLVVRVPYEQKACNDKLVEILTSPERGRWADNGVAFGERSDIYRLVEHAVDELEAFAGGAYRRPAPKPEMAFCLLKYTPYGGLQRAFLRTALRCQQLGYRIRIYALAWEGRIPDGMDVVIVRAAGLTDHARCARFAQEVAAALRAQPAMCWVGFHPMPGLDVYYAAERCIAANAPPRPSGIDWQNPRRRYFEAAERSVFARGTATKLLLVAPEQRSEFEYHYETEPERFVVLPPGVTRDRIAPDNAAEVRAAMRAELGVGGDEFLLLTIGPRFIDRGLDRSLLALAQLPTPLQRRVRLIAIGNDNVRSFNRMAERLRVADRFAMLPNRDDIPRFLQAADVLLHPAYADAAGTVPLEALVGGLPSIITDVCGNSAAIERAEAGRVIAAPFRQDAFNAALVEMLGDAVLRATRRRNGIAAGRAFDPRGLPEVAARCIVEAAERAISTSNGRHDERIG
jgi:UDP-glucose:(heptosyl)LPS alpha-1,3-glucosyltransferase